MFGHKNTGPRGAILVDGKQVADTIQCVHCGKHWVPQPGSGIRRAFCFKCMGPACGSAACDTCYPFEKQLEDVEKYMAKFGGGLGGGQIAPSPGGILLPKHDPLHPLIK